MFDETIIPLANIVSICFIGPIICFIGPIWYNKNRELQIVGFGRSKAQFLWNIYAVYTFLCYTEKTSTEKE